MRCASRRPRPGRSHCGNRGVTRRPATGVPREGVGHASSLRFLVIASCGLAASLAAAASSTAVEYYHGGYGHYFVTASPQEIAALDAGGFSRLEPHRGVVRRVRPRTPPASANVCRFWSGQTFAPKSSHFYTPFDWECAKVKGNPTGGSRAKCSR